jgi:hypothetical protein
MLGWVQTQSVDQRIALSVLSPLLSKYRPSLFYGSSQGYSDVAVRALIREFYAIGARPLLYEMLKFQRPALFGCQEQTKIGFSCAALLGSQQRL